MIDQFIKDKITIHFNLLSKVLVYACQTDRIINNTELLITPPFYSPKYLSNKLFGHYIFRPTGYFSSSEICFKK